VVAEVVDSQADSSSVDQGENEGSKVWDWFVDEGMSIGDGECSNFSGDCDGAGCDEEG
jgi:hypothetical protein